MRIAQLGEGAQGKIALLIMWEKLRFQRRDGNFSAFLKRKPLPTCGGGQVDREQFTLRNHAHFCTNSGISMQKSEKIENPSPSSRQIGKNNMITWERVVEYQI